MSEGVHNRRKKGKEDSLDSGLGDGVAGGDFCQDCEYKEE